MIAELRHKHAQVEYLYTINILIPLLDEFDILFYNRNVIRYGNNVSYSNIVYAGFPWHTSNRGIQYWTGINRTIVEEIRISTHIDHI